MLRLCRYGIFDALDMGSPARMADGLSEWWSPPACTPCARAMIPRMLAVTPLLLVARRHVDFGRVTCMSCRLA